MTANETEQNEPGAVRPVLRVHVRPGDKVLVLGDTHGGINDWDATRLVLDVGEALGVTHVDLNGDNADAHGISRHPKEPDRVVQTLAHEALELDRIMTRIDQIPTLLPWGKHAKGGNHDDRVYDVVEEYPALLGVEWPDWWRVDGESVYVKHGWWCVRRGAATRYGDVMVEHGDRMNGIARGGGKDAAKKVLDNYPAQCTVFGHCHTLDRRERVVWTYGRPVLRGAWGAGHLSLRDKHPYAGDHSFEQGGVVIEFFDPGDAPRLDCRAGDCTDPRASFQVHSLRVQRDAQDHPIIRFGGRTYR